MTPTQKKKNAEARKSRTALIRKHRGKEPVAKKGRPTKYNPEHDKMLFRLCLLGATNEELAKALDINIDTLYAWMHDDPVFSDALKKGREEADGNVVGALYKKAVGYKYEEEVMTQQGVQTIIKTAQPDTTSIIFFLKNRRPDKWRDRHEYKHEVSGIDEEKSKLTDIFFKKPNAKK